MINKPTFNGLRKKAVAQLNTFQVSLTLRRNYNSQTFETVSNIFLHQFSLPAVPTAELVKRVKELYHKRVSDVRFLIPVLTGLKKQEIIAVLPKLIKQSPSVVKEVFNRLLGCFHSK